MPTTDPVDGTAAFAESEAPQFGEHLTLVSKQTAFRGTRMIGSAADMSAFASDGYARTGDRWFNTTDELEYQFSSSAWKRVSGLFVARRAGTQTMVASGWHGLGDAYGTPEINTMGTWGSGALQVAMSGWVRVVGNTRFQNISDPMALQVTRNSTLPDVGVVLDVYADSPTQAMSVSGVIPVTSGDVLRVLVYTSVANSIDTVNTRGVQLSVELIQAS